MTEHTAPVVVERLDPNAVEPGTIARFYVELVQDPLQPVRLPAIVARGVEEGPVFGITAAVHGNEVNGIPVIQRLFAELDPQKLRGTVVGVPVVSAYAFNGSTRTFFEGFDLNRIMPGRPDGNVGEVYAHRVIDRLVRHFDYFVDLHTASFGRVNSLYVRADLRHGISRRMAFLQKPEIVVHNEAKDGTLRDAAMDLGIPGITVEVGDPLRFQRQLIRDSLHGVQAILSELGFVEPHDHDDDGQPVVCGRSKWIYAQTGGLLEVLPATAAMVKKGQEIARVRNPFGDVLATYHAPEAGIVVGKSTNPICRTGSRILHLGIIAKPGAFA